MRKTQLFRTCHSQEGDSYKFIWIKLRYVLEIFSYTKQNCKTLSYVTLVDIDCSNIMSIGTGKPTLDEKIKDIPKNPFVGYICFTDSQTYWRVPKNGKHNRFLGVRLPHTITEKKPLSYIYNMMVVYRALAVCHPHLPQHRHSASWLGSSSSSSLPLWLSFDEEHPHELVRIGVLLLQSIV